MAATAYPHMIFATGADVITKELLHEVLTEAYPKGTVSDAPLKSVLQIDGYTFNFWFDDEAEGLAQRYAGYLPEGARRRRLIACTTMIDFHGAPDPEESHRQDAERIVNELAELDGVWVFSEETKRFVALDYGEPPLPAEPLPTAQAPGADAAEPQPSRPPLAQPGQPQPGEPQPGEPQPSEPQPSEPQPGEPQPTETKPGPELAPTLDATEQATHETLGHGPGPVIHQDVRFNEAVAPDTPATAPHADDAVPTVPEAADDVAAPSPQVADHPIEPTVESGWSSPGSAASADRVVPLPAAAGDPRHDIPQPGQAAAEQEASQHPDPPAVISPSQPAAHEQPAAYQQPGIPIPPGHDPTTRAAVPGSLRPGGPDDESVDPGAEAKTGFFKRVFKRKDP